MNAEAAGSPASDKISQQILGIANDEGVPVETVERLYRTELERLGIQARIVDFLPVLAVNNLKRRLRDQRRARPLAHAVPNES
jgi:hypothetical protein